MKKLHRLLIILLAWGFLAACSDDDAGANKVDADSGQADATSEDTSSEDTSLPGDPDARDDEDAAGLRECRGDSDCHGEEVCMIDRSESPVALYCAGPHPGGGELGDSCSDDADCAQSLCLSGVCSSACASNDDCSGAEGFVCERTAIDLEDGESASVQVCAPPRACERSADCRVGEACRIDRDSGEAICGPKNPGGGDLGDVCAEDADCAENLCLEGRFRDVCANACQSDSDCSTPGYECKTTELDEGNNSIKACAPKDPPSCTSKEDCDSGLTCAIIPDADGDALERACIPTAGEENGAACSEDADCASLACINEVCSDPCTDTEQCTDDQICRSNTVSRDGLSASFDMCESLGEERCDQDGVCSDGLRMCNELYQVSDSDAYEAYCGMPNSDADGELGDTCQGDEQCRSDICLTGMSDECSVICDSDSQCGSGQVCTAYRVGPSTQIGYCVTSCERDNDCSALGFDEGGEAVDHVCNINLNPRENAVDQVCTRREPVDDNGDPLGQLGADCESASTPGQGDDALCQGGLCQQNTVFTSTSCDSDSQCDSGELCLEDPDGQKKCGERNYACTRLCSNNDDCTGGESGNTMDTCSPGTAITLPGGGSDTIATCSAPS